MDSAQFIRRRSVFIAWVIVPLALAALTTISAHSFMERQQITLVQKRTLQRVIPDMILALEEFHDFIAPHIIPIDAITSIEDASITLLSAAAEQAGFTLTSMGLAQTPVDKAQGIVRIDIHIKGEGTGHNLISFLQGIKAKDRFIYETQVSISTAGRNTPLYKLEATLSKIYIELPGGS